MRCRKVGRRFLIRLEKGEEILATLRAFVRREGIPGGTISGLGAVDEITVGFYDVGRKEYRFYEHAGHIEVLALAGNIAWRDAEPVVHVHVSAAHETEGAFGGHLSSGAVSATLEVLIDPLDERVERAPDAVVGLPLLDLPPYPLS